MMKIVAVIRLSTDVFNIVVGDGSTTCETLCTMEASKTPSGEEIRHMNFASEDFNKRLMKGEIDFFEIRSAIQVQNLLAGGTSKE